MTLSGVHDNVWLPNGASGTVTDVSNDMSSININFHGNGCVTLKKVSSLKVVINGVEYKRIGYPLELGIATTAHSCQGRTIHGPLVVELNCDGRWWDPRMLYVLLTRVTRLVDIIVCGRIDEQYLMKIIKQKSLNKTISLWLKRYDIESVKDSIWLRHQILI